MDELTIRPARPSEAPELTRLAHDAKAFWGYSEEQLSAWEPDLTITEHLIESARVECAILGGQIVGFSALADRPDHAELEHLWVRPNFMGRGVGSALFNRAAETARAAGKSALVVISDPHAADFYLRMGAIQVGRHESVPPGRFLPVLTLDLSHD